jgi:hypothetical protein
MVRMDRAFHPPVVQVNVADRALTSMLMHKKRKPKKGRIGQPLKLTYG